MSAIREVSPVETKGACELADPRQLLAEHNVDNPRAADGSFHQHHSRMFADDFAEAKRTPVWMMKYRGPADGFRRSCEMA